MTRRLNKSVLAGGVVYAAGTPATEELEQRIANPDHWSEDGVPVAADGFGDELDESHPVTAELKSLVQFLAEQHLVDRERPVEDLLRDAAVAYGLQVADPHSGGDPGGDPGGDGGTKPPSPEGLQPPYDEADVAALRAEIDRRNGDRDPDGEGYIRADRRSKDPMVAALKADDDAAAASGQGQG